jgi:hypothetical protein
MDMLNKKAINKILVSFSNQCEIRMGSPFNVATVEMSGSWKPDIPTDGWQDISAQSPDGRYVGLIFWDTPNNEPGFKVYTIDTVEKTISISNRIRGCCQYLEWKEEINKFNFRMF